MTRTSTIAQEALSTEIRRQLGNDTTRRFLRAMPIFRPADAVPDYLRDLLDRLESEEQVRVGSK